MVAVSLKNRVYAFDNFYYESGLLYNYQNRNKFQLLFIYILRFIGNKT